MWTYKKPCVCKWNECMYAYAAFYIIQIHNQLHTTSAQCISAFLAAVTVFLISMLTVMGPTPPGTGVMKPAFSFTPAHIRKSHEVKGTRYFNIWFLCNKTQVRKWVYMSGTFFCIRYVSVLYTLTKREKWQSGSTNLMGLFCFSLLKNSDATFWLLTLKVHVTNEPDLSRFRVLYAVDAHVDDRCTLFNHISCDQTRHTY